MFQAIHPSFSVSQTHFTFKCTKIRGDKQIQFTIHFRFKCQQTQSKAMHCPCKRNDFKLRELWGYERECLSFLREQESIDWWRGGYCIKYPDVLILARLDDSHLRVPKRSNLGSAKFRKCRRCFNSVCKIFVRTFTIICSCVGLFIAKNSLSTLRF